MNREIALRLQRAGRTLEAAESLLADGYLEEAVTRMYYGMFYAGTAMHLAEGRRYKNHESLIAEFGKFVISGGSTRRFITISKMLMGFGNRRITITKVRRFPWMGRETFSEAPASF